MNRGFVEHSAMNRCLLCASLESNKCMTNRALHRLFVFRRIQNRSTEGCSKLKSPEKKTSSGEIGLDIRIHASPKVGQGQVSGGVSVLCCHAAPVANVLWKPHTIR